MLIPPVKFCCWLRVILRIIFDKILVLFCFVLMSQRGLPAVVANRLWHPCLLLLWLPHPLPPAAPACCPVLLLPLAACSCWVSICCSLACCPSTTTIFPPGRCDHLFRFGHNHTRFYQDHQSRKTWNEWQIEMCKQSWTTDISIDSAKLLPLCQSCYMDLNITKLLLMFSSHHRTNLRPTVWH